MDRQGQRTALYFVYAAAVTALVLGTVARFKGLGTWSLANDEYLMAYGVGQILDHGVPRFAAGGYYVRGIAYQYLQALVLAIFGLPEEFSLRAVNASCSLITIPALYLLTRKAGGRIAACLAVILFSLSLWQIETARYVRMYAPFQAVFAWYCLQFYRHVIEGHRRAFKWMIVLSVLGTFVYEGGMFLLVMNLLPALLSAEARRLRDIALSALLLMGSLVYLGIDFRRLGVTDYLPADLVDRGASTRDLLPVIDDPQMFVATLSGLGWWFAFAGFVVLVGWCSFVVLRDRELDLRLRVTLVCCGFLALVNLYGLILLAGATLWMLGWLGPKQLRSRSLWKLAGALVAVGAFWIVFGLSTSAWHGYFPAEGFNPIKKIAVMLLKYPDIYLKIVHEWAIGMPRTTLLLALALAAGLLLSELEGGPRWRPYRLFIAVLIMLGTLVGLVPMVYKGAKYTLFLYPILIFAVAIAATRLSARIPLPRRAVALLPLLLVGAYIAVSDDYGWYHLAHVDRADVNFRLIYPSTDRQFHFWYRIDYKTPALKINESLAPSDLVVVSRVGPVTHYLDRVDYFFQPETYVGLRQVTTDSGRREIWTNAKLVYTETALTDLLDNAQQTIWLVMHSSEFPYQDKTEAKMAAKYADRLFYRSIDGRIDVYRIEPAARG